MRLIQAVVRRVEILCSRSPALARMYCRPYRQVVANEIRLGGLTKDDTILNIGCGSVPFTAILMAQQTKASVCAIDLDPRAVANAKRCIAALGLSEQITVECADGTWYVPQQDCSAVVVALQAEPKTMILRHWAALQQRSIRVLMRAPSRPFRHHYDAPPAQPKPAARIAQDMKTFDETVLYLCCGASYG